MPRSPNLLATYAARPRGDGRRCSRWYRGDRCRAAEQGTSSRASRKAGEIGRDRLRELGAVVSDRLHKENAGVADDDIGTPRSAVTRATTFPPRRGWSHRTADRSGGRWCRLSGCGPGDHVRAGPRSRSDRGPMRGAGDERELPTSGAAVTCRPPCTRRTRRAPRLQQAPHKRARDRLGSASTPRIIMQRWYASMTTPTPRGSSTRIRASAT
jgi:hypothetical protein